MTVQSNRSQLLIAISSALPFLFIRLLYTMLSAFNPTNSIYNPISGEISVYVLMYVLMECIAVLIYVTAGFMLPLGHPQTEYKATAGKPDDEELNRLTASGAPHNEYPVTTAYNEPEYRYNS